MADMLSIAVSGLQAFQQALDVTSNNIANSATPGYSVESVDLGTQAPSSFGSGYGGSGVTVANVNRAYSSILATQMWNASSANSRLSAFTANAQAVSNLFGDTTTGLAAQLTAFTNSVQGVANSPTSTAARQVLLGQAGALQQSFQNYNGTLQTLQSQINTQLTGEAASITSIAKSIANLNGQIASAAGQGDKNPNALMDSLDQQIANLAQHVSVTVVSQPDGEANVFIGQGQTLVLGSQAGNIVTQGDPYNASQVSLAFQSAGSSASVPLDSTLSGGTVGGLLDFRSQMLNPAINTLGQIAVALTSTVNTQQASGLDLKGAQGTPLFSVGSPQVTPNGSNTGSGSVTASVTNVGALTTSDYILSYNGTTWTMQDAATGSPVTLSGSGTSASPLTGAGLSLVVAGTPAAGDSFEVQPTAGAVAGMQVLITDPSKIAAASALTASAATTNTGNASAASPVVTNPANAALLTPATISFTSATQYTLGGTSYTYTSGTPIVGNGWSVTLTGTPAAGDSFSIGPNTAAVGDNTNALAIANVLGQGILNNGSTNLNQSVASFIGSIGVTTNQAQTALSAQQTVYTNSQNAMSSVSGVNLDEEAANLVKYQQAYQAAAQVVKATESMFASLLTAVQSA